LPACLSRAPPKDPPPDGGERIVELCFDDPFSDYDTDPVLAQMFGLGEDEMSAKRNTTDTAPAMLTGLRPYALIMVVGLLIYGQCVSFDFTYCDDLTDVVDRHALNDGYSKVPLAFKSSFGTLYRPVLRTSWIVDESFGGTDPLVYHVSNVLYHLIAAFMVFFALLKLSTPRHYALIFSLLFVAHPLFVQAVVWIPGRNDSLLAIFVLLSLISLLDLLKDGQPFQYALHFFVFALALFTKETAALFPVIGIYFLWVIRGIKPLSGRSVGLVGGWLLIGVLWLLARNAALDDTPRTDLVGLPAFIQNLPSLPALLGKFIFPWKLTGLATFEPASTTAGLLFIAVLVLLCIFAKKIDYKMAGFGFLWVAVFIIPAMFHRLAHAADHYDYLEHRAYLPSFGLLVVLIQIAVGYGFSMKRKPAIYLFVVVLVLLSARGIVYSRSFKDMFGFWEHAIEHNPSRSNFHSVLGKLYFDRREYKKAEACFLKAKSLSRCNDPINYRNLAAVYYSLDEPEKALAVLKEAVELDPENADFHLRLGKAFYKINMNDEAEAAFRAASKLDPRNTEVISNLAGVYERRGQMDEVVATCKKILEIDPNHYVSCNYMGSLYARQEEWDKAAEMWRRAIKTKPDELQPYEGLMRYHLRFGRRENAQYYGTEILRRGGDLSSENRKQLGLQ